MVTSAPWVTPWPCRPGWALGGRPRRSCQAGKDQLDNVGTAEGEVVGDKGVEEGAGGRLYLAAT